MEPPIRLPGPDALRVYVNGTGHSVPLGSTALDAVRLADADAGVAIAAGEKQITDSRGLPLDADTPAHSGAIYRIVRARAAADH